VSSKRQRSKDLLDASILTSGTCPAVNAMTSARLGCSGSGLGGALAHAALKTRAKIITHKIN